MILVCLSKFKCGTLRSLLLLLHLQILFMINLVRNIIWNFHEFPRVWFIVDNSKCGIQWIICLINGKLRLSNGLFLISFFKVIPTQNIKQFSSFVFCLEYFILLFSFVNMFSFYFGPYFIIKKVENIIIKLKALWKLSVC